MANKYWIAIAVVVVVLLAAYFFWWQPATPAPTPAAPQKPQPTALTGVEVVYDGSRFVPPTVNIKKGSVVVFKNNSNVQMWPASALHPTHRAYPGSDIEKCFTSAKTEIFDACGNVNSGGSWSFRFEEIGEWQYHDHLQPTQTGTIIVE